MFRENRLRVGGAAFAVGATLALGACSAPELDQSQATPAPKVCEEFPLVKADGWGGILSALKFTKDPGCEVPIRPTPNEFILQVGSVTTKSTFFVDCTGGNMAPRLFGHLQEQRSGDPIISHGYVDLAFDSISDHTLQAAIINLPECPPDNSDLM